MYQRMRSKGTSWAGPRQNIGFNTPPYITISTPENLGSTIENDLLTIWSWVYNILFKSIFLEHINFYFQDILMSIVGKYMLRAN